MPITQDELKALSAEAAKWPADSVPFPNEEEQKDLMESSTTQEVVGPNRSNTMFVPVTAVKYQYPTLKTEVQVPVSVEAMCAIDPTIGPSNMMSSELHQAAGFRDDSKSPKKTLEVYNYLAARASDRLMQKMGETGGLTCFRCNDVAIGVKGLTIYQPQGDEPIFGEYLSTAHCSKVACVNSALLKVLRSSGEKIEGTTRAYCLCCKKSKSRKDKLYACGKCKMARYCSKACQRAHWKCHEPTCKLGSKVCSK
jgi:hypothetical protein